jgi:hypothetical protein
MTGNTSEYVAYGHSFENVILMSTKAKLMRPGFENFEITLFV